MRWMIAPREPRPGDRLFVLAASALVAALVAGVLLALGGASPLSGLHTLIVEPLTTGAGLSETLLLATPIALCALSVSLARWLGLWNIGAEGQLLFGAFVATGLALYSAGTGGALSVPLLFGAGALGGALWAAAPILLRERLGVSEILSTLMLNYVAVAWVELWVFGPWKGPNNYPYTVDIAAVWQLPTLWRRLHVGFALVPLIAVFMAWLYRSTLFGYQARLIGASPEAARYAGLPVAERQISAFLAAGALAGLAGAVQISGVHHRLEGSVALGYGYTAILAAFVAGGRPGWAVAISVLLGALEVGGLGLAVDFPGVSSALVVVLKGVLFVTLLSGEALTRNRLVRRDPDGEGA